MGQRIGVRSWIGIEEQKLQYLMIGKGVRPDEKFSFQAPAMAVVNTHGKTPFPKYSMCWGRAPNAYADRRYEV